MTTELKTTKLTCCATMLDFLVTHRDQICAHGWKYPMVCEIAGHREVFRSEEELDAVIARLRRTTVTKPHNNDDV